MNFDDFGIWMRETQRAIPAISAWLKTQENSGKGVWKVWRIALDGLDLKTATEAVQRIVKDPKLQVWGNRWDQFPGQVVQLCGSQKQQPRGDRKCICQGDGIVEVLVAGRVNTNEGNPLRCWEIDGGVWSGPIGAACLCPKGRWVNAHRNEKFPDYTHRGMRVYHGTDDIFAPRLESEERASMQQAMLDFNNAAVGAATNYDLDLPFQ